jgi:VanZ family protein
MILERFYKILLNLYPREFREQYGEEMTQVFQENLASEGSSFKLWIQTFADVFSSASREHVQGDRMSLLNKLAGISSVVIGVWQVVFFVQVLRNDLPTVASGIEVALHSLLFVLVFSGLLACPVKQRNQVWWLTISSLVVILPLILTATFGPKIPVLEWVLHNNEYLMVALMTCTCLNFVRLEQKRFVFMPEFWGLVVLLLSEVIQRFWIGPIVLDRPMTGRWDLILGSTAFISGWIVLGFALWSRASNPQPRAMT